MNGESAGRRSRPEMPSYFRKDRVGRDEFLSQLGHFSEDHRAIFSRICDLWEADVPYDRFFSELGNEYMNAEASLHTLMNHLERGRCGIVSQAVRDGRLLKDRIILTDRDSPRFWYWMVENAWQTCRVSDRRAFPSLKEFRLLPGFSEKLLSPLALTEVSDAFIRVHGEEVVLYVLPELDGTSLVATPSSLSSVLDVARLKIRTILNDTPLLPEVARLLGTVVSFMHKALTHTENGFWSKLADAFITHKDDLLAKRANIPSEIFVAAKILKIYCRNELVEAEQRREEEADKRGTIRAILVKLSRKEEFLISQKEFDAQFEPYKDQWPDLKNLFVTHYMQSSGRTGLPPVVTLGEDLLPRNQIYPLFKAQHRMASVELKNFYLGMIERILKTDNKDRITAFAGIGAFRADVRERLADGFPILSQLLARPRVVSEGTIYYATKVLKISNMERVKSVLYRYFDAGTIRFKEPDILFDLPPRIMFRDAFLKLSWFLRIMLKMMGRYDSFVQAMDSPAGSSSSGEYGVPGRSDSGSGSGTMAMPGGSDDVPEISDFASNSGSSGSSSGRRAGGRAERQTGGIPSGSRRKKTPPSAANQKRYSMQQQQEAWDEFRSAYRKKRGD